MRRLLMLVCCLILMNAMTSHAGTPSFQDFDRRARNGERLNVVFFGASLTWGANASDPNLTSYRALVGARLEKAYPKARFKFWDAAIGGTGSQLGVFRFERNVLRRKPDLVFLDFSANDDINSDNPETLASYESLVRRAILQAHAPVVQVILPFMWNVAAGKTDGMKRRDAHLKIARFYNTAAGDAIALGLQRVQSGALTLPQIWPLDGVHPGDKGYAMFADAVFAAYQSAVRKKTVCRAPRGMLYDDTYMTSARVRISSLGALPEGWRAGVPNRVSAYFDFLMSRWLDDEVIASNRREVTADDGKKSKVPQEVGRLKAKFRGRMVMLLGEATQQSGRYRVYLDGKQVERKDGDKTLTEFDPGAFANMIKGNGHHAQVIAENLDSNIEHTLEIEPVFAADVEQELRLESICVAGGAATVSLQNKD